MRARDKIISNFEKLERTLRRFRLSNDVIQETIEHEKAHFDKATELGYSPQIKLRIQREGLRLVGLYAIIDVSSINRQDNPQIAFAPKNPSYIDMNTDQGYGAPGGVI
jgi:hypothetical protein